MNNIAKLLPIILNIILSAILAISTIQSTKYTGMITNATIQTNRPYLYIDSFKRENNNTGENKLFTITIKNSGAYPAKYNLTANFIKDNQTIETYNNQRDLMVFPTQDGSTLDMIKGNTGLKLTIKYKDGKTLIMTFHKKLSDLLKSGEKFTINLKIDYQGISDQNENKKYFFEESIEINKDQKKVISTKGN